MSEDIRAAANRIATIWSADVARWHHNPSRILRYSGDTTQAHACRVAKLQAMLFEDTTARELLIALHHDDAESVTGDVSGEAKRRNEVIRQAHDWAEADTALKWGLPIPETDRERNRLALCDKLDAWMWVKETDPSQLSLPDWVDVGHGIWKLAHRLGVGHVVQEILRDREVAQ